MGAGIQAAKVSGQGIDGAKRKHRPELPVIGPRRRVGPRPKDKRRPDALHVLTGTVKHYFPLWPMWLRSVVDPRAFHKYEASVLLLMAVLMFCTRSESRRAFQEGNEDNEGLRRVLESLSGEEVPEVPHVDTMNNFLERIDSAFFLMLIAELTGTLIRANVLKPLRVGGKLPLYVDATELMRSRRPHCDACLTTIHNRGTDGEYTEYHHAALLAYIIAPNGLLMPVSVIFLENTLDSAGNRVYDKQDCEKNAFYRLLVELSMRYPRTEFGIISDGLYADQHVFAACEGRGSECAAVLSKDSCPAVHREIERLLREQGGADGQANHLVRHSHITAPRRKGLNPRLWKVTREYAWCSNVTFGDRSLHFLSFTQTVEDEDGKAVVDLHYHNEWLTTTRTCRKTVEALADLFRRRWKIENEGNQTQKKEYGLEHGYGTKGFAWKNYPLLIQIAQLFNSLARLGDLGERERRRLPAAAADPPRKKLWPTLRDFAARLRIAIREHDPCRLEETLARLTGTRLHLHLLEAAA